MKKLAVRYRGASLAHLKKIIDELLGVYWAPGDGAKPPPFIQRAYDAIGKNPPPWGAQLERLKKGGDD